MIHKLKMNVELVTDPNQWAWNNFDILSFIQTARLTCSPIHESSTYDSYIWFIWYNCAKPATVYNCNDIHEF